MLPGDRKIKLCPASQVKKTKVRPDGSSAPTQLALCLRLATTYDSTPQCRISELRVWSYEPFIVSAPSSSD